MKTKRIEKLNMLLNLKDFLGKNRKLWENIVEIDKAIKKLYNNIDFLKELKSDIDIDLGKLKTQKNEQKKALINEALPIVNIIKAYAIECKDKNLFKKSDVRRKKLEKSKDTGLSEYCKGIWKEAGKLVKRSHTAGENLVVEAAEQKSILNYGLSQQMIENLKEVLESFKRACLNFDDAKSERNKNIIEFKSFLKKSDSILKNKLDLLFSIFETNKPDFYTSYKKTREIEKIVKAKKKKEPKTGKKIEKAEVVEAEVVKPEALQKPLKKPIPPASKVPKKPVAGKKPVTKKVASNKYPISKFKRPAAKKPEKPKTDANTSEA